MTEDAAFTRPDTARKRPIAMAARLVWLAPVLLIVILAGALFLGLDSDRDPKAVPSVMIGKPVPEFSLHEAPRPVPEIAFQDGKGKPNSIADFRGKVVLLNIWATWCGPCKREMPTLDRLQAQLGGTGFEVVALSIDRKGLDIVRKFYAEVNVRHLATYIDSSGKASRQLGVVGLPTTLLIGREGRELGRLIGPAEWDSPEMVDFIRSRLQRGAGYGTSTTTPPAAKKSITTAASASSHSKPLFKRRN